MSRGRRQITIQELKVLLDQYAGNLPVKFVAGLTMHGSDCGSDPDCGCYCVEEDCTFSIDSLAREEKLERKTGRQATVCVLIRGVKD